MKNIEEIKKFVDVLKEHHTKITLEKEEKYKKLTKTVEPIAQQLADKTIEALEQLLKNEEDPWFLDDDKTVKLFDLEKKKLAGKNCSDEKMYAIINTVYAKFCDQELTTLYPFSVGLKFDEVNVFLLSTKPLENSIHGKIGQLFFEKREKQKVLREAARNDLKLKKIKAIDVVCENILEKIEKLASTITNIVLTNSSGEILVAQFPISEYDENIIFEACRKLNFAYKIHIRSQTTQNKINVFLKLKT